MSHSDYVRRKTDWAFFAYFLFQIPSTFFFDSQGVYPVWLYPNWAKSLRAHYLDSYKDAFLENAWSHPWYLSFCLVEHYIEFPFFFWAAYMYYQGVSARSRILLPSLLYGVHTVTVVLAVWVAAMMTDFTDTTATVWPQTTAQRLKLCSAYSPFIIFSTWMAIDSSLDLLKLKPLQQPVEKKD